MHYNHNFRRTTNNNITLNDLATSLTGGGSGRGLPSSAAAAAAAHFAGTMSANYNFGSTLVQPTAAIFQRSALSYFDNNAVTENIIAKPGLNGVGVGGIAEQQHQRFHHPYRRSAGAGHIRGPANAIGNLLVNDAEEIVRQRHQMLKSSKYLPQMSSNERLTLPTINVENEVQQQARAAAALDMFSNAAVAAAAAQHQQLTAAVAAVAAATNEAAAAAAQPNGGANTAATLNSIGEQYEQILSQLLQPYFHPLPAAAASMLLMNGAAAASANGRAQSVAQPTVLDQQQHVLRSHVSTVSCKSIPHADRPVNLENFRTKRPIDWSMEDVWSWMIDFAEQRNISADYLNMANFVNCTGMKLITLDRKQFQEMDEMYGDQLYDEFKKLAASDYAVFDDVLRATTGISLSNRRRSPISLSSATSSSSLSTTNGSATGASSSTSSGSSHHHRRSPTTNNSSSSTAAAAAAAASSSSSSRCCAATPPYHGTGTAGAGSAGGTLLFNNNGGAASTSSSTPLIEEQQQRAAAAFCRQTLASLGMDMEPQQNKQNRLLHQQQHSDQPSTSATTLYDHNHQQQQRHHHSQEDFLSMIDNANNGSLNRFKRNSGSRSSATSLAAAVASNEEFLAVAAAAAAFGRDSVIKTAGCDNDGTIPSSPSSNIGPIAVPGYNSNNNSSTPSSNSVSSVLQKKLKSRQDQQHCHQQQQQQQRDLLFQNGYHQGHLYNNQHHLSSTGSSPLSARFANGSGYSSPSTSTRINTGRIYKKSGGLHHQNNCSLLMKQQQQHGVDDVILTASGKPRKRSQHTKGNKLWEFIRDALKNPETCPSVVKWEDPEQGVFRIIESEKLAQLWGKKKNNQKMTYEKLSRAMRTYYEKKILEPVPKTGLYPKKLVYKFGPTSHGWQPEHQQQAATNCQQQQQPSNFSTQNLFPNNNNTTNTNNLLVDDNNNNNNNLALMRRQNQQQQQQHCLNLNEILMSNSNGMGGTVMNGILASALNQQQEPIAANIASPTGGPNNEAASTAQLKIEMAAAALFLSQFNAAAAAVAAAAAANSSSTTTTSSSDPAVVDPNSNNTNDNNIESVTPVPSSMMDCWQNGMMINNETPTTSGDNEVQQQQQQMTSDSPAPLRINIKEEEEDEELTTQSPSSNNNNRDEAMMKDIDHESSFQMDESL